MNSDTVGDYKAELDCNIENAACEYLTNQLKILSVQFLMTKKYLIDPYNLN